MEWSPVDESFFLSENLVRWCTGTVGPEMDEAIHVHVRDTIRLHLSWIHVIRIDDDQVDDFGRSRTNVDYSNQTQFYKLTRKKDNLSEIQFQLIFTGNFQLVDVASCPLY